MELPNQAEIETALEILKRIPSSKADLFPNLCDEGNRLFGRGIRKAIFEDSNLLKVWREQKKTLKKLEKVRVLMS